MPGLARPLETRHSPTENGARTRVDPAGRIGKNLCMQGPLDIKPPSPANCVDASSGSNAAGNGRSGPGRVLPAAAVFALALLVRSIYLYEIRTIPFIEHLSVDAESYDAWARRIAAGDWWGDEVFYQAPAYPYFLGVLYAVAGRNLWFVHGVQVVRGALSCLLVYLAGRRFFGHRTGLVAGLLLALYPPAIFFDGLIQKAGLGLFLTTLLLYVLGRAQERAGAATFVVGGLVTALLALTRENALLFVPAIPVWMLVRFRDRPSRRRWGWIAGFLGGVGALLVPVGLRNLSVGGTFALTTSQMGTNFYIGNNPQADGLYAPLVPGRQGPAYERRDAEELAEQALGRALIPGEVSRYWFGRGRQFVQERPAAWLRLMLRKWALVWNHFEVPDAEGLCVYEQWSVLLRSMNLFLHFGVLVPLGVAGVVLSWRHRRDLWILYLLVLTTAASVALFYVFARYRFPLVPVLVLFGGCACVEGYERWRARRLHAVAVAAISAAVIAMWVNRSVLPEAYYRSISYANLGAICARSGQHDEAEQYLAVALKMCPDSAPAHRHLGHLRAEQGRTAESHYYLGLAAGEMNDLEGAATHYRLAIEADPRFLSAHYNLGAVLARQGRFDEAAAAMKRCLELVPTSAPAALVERIQDRIERYRAHDPGETPTEPPVWTSGKPAT